MLAKKRTNEEWRNLLAEQRASGQTQEEWCTANGVNLYTLRDRASRLRKLDRQEETANTEPSQQPKQPEVVSGCWVEVTPEKQPDNSVGIRIEHEGFSIMVERGFDPELLVLILRAVSRACC